MSAKDVVDALIRLLQVLISWPVIFLCVVLLLRKELPTLTAKLADRITKAPGGFEFAAIQAKVDTLSAKVEKLETVMFEPSAALTPELQTQLQSSLDAFQAYLGKVGYESQTGMVAVYVDPELKDNVYYSDNRIVLGAPLAKDPDAVLREYTHHALVESVDWNTLTTQMQAVESGLADYFPCSFNNDPLFGKDALQVFRKYPGLEGKKAVRNLSNDRTFDAASTKAEYHDVGEIWGGVFWDLRQRLGRAAADKLLFSTWIAVRSATTGRGFNLTFAKKLLEFAKSLEGSDKSPDIQAILRRRGLRV